MLNKITLHGYLGRDPELSEHEGQNGPYKKAAWSMAVSRDFGDESDWFYCVIYGKRAEVVKKYFTIGSQMLVTGRMESYKPKKDPEHTAWIVKVEDFDFCDKANGSSQKSDKPAPAEDVPDSMEAIDEDVPF